MDKIIILIDYKEIFGSKYDSVPYRSGMDKGILKECFTDKGFDVEYIQFSDVIHYDILFWKGKLVIYTSSEDIGYFYKSYIEDIVFFLELNGALVIPPHKYLKANNNKVFMELLRKSINSRFSEGIDSGVFGCLEETDCFLDQTKFPVVFKQSTGAMSKGVGIGLNKKDIQRKLKKISSTPHLFEELKDFYRSFLYKGYRKESKYRKKFVLQQFIPFLKGDYKVLIFSNNYFVLQRGLKPNDFRASGSGIRNYVKDLPKGLLSFSYSFFQELNVPNVSLDIAFNGTSFFLIEFQCVYFGSYTLTFSDYHWQLKDKQFELVEKRCSLESEYANSVVDFVKSL